MLYDILSPLAFFFALGGILIIMGRVVIRVRRQDLSTSMKSSAGEVSSTSAHGWQPSTREMSQLLKPSQKSVQALRSRFAVVRQTLTQTRQGIGAWQQRRSARQAIRKEQKHVEAEAVVSPVVPTPAEAPHTSVVTAPVRRMTRARLAFWRRGGTRDVAGSPPVPTTTKETIVPAPAVTVSRSIMIEKKAATAPDAPVAPASRHVPAPQSPIPQPAVPATDVSASDRSFASSLLRRVQGKTKVTATVLQAAEEQLASQHFQAAEDVLVPHIVKHPKDTAAYMLLGKAAIGRQAWEEAIEIFEQVIKWNRKVAGAYAGLGHAAYQAGHFTRALETLQRAHDADPTDVSVLEELLSIAEKMDNPALQHSIRSKIEALTASVVGLNQKGG